MRYRWKVSDAIQARSRRGTRARIIDVAARLLQEEGPAAVATRGVAQGAGVQAPTIYRLFGDKDGLLEAVAEHVMATYVSAKAAFVEAASAGNVDPLDDLRAGWMTQIDFGVANPALFALMSDPGRVLHSPAAQPGKHVLESRVHRVAVTGRLRVSSSEPSTSSVQPESVPWSRPCRRRTGKRDPGLAHGMYKAVLRQILTDAPQPVESGPMATAVAFRAIVPGLDMLSDAERQFLAEWLDRAIDGLWYSSRRS